MSEVRRELAQLVDHPHETLQLWHCSRCSHLTDGFRFLWVGTYVTLVDSMTEEGDGGLAEFAFLDV